MSDIREQLADYAHKAWSGYMGYFLGRCRIQPDGSLVIPSGYVQALEHLIATPYADLTEADKHGDREEADRMLQIIGVLDGD